MQNVSGESTLEATNAFEQYCMTCGVTPKRYHADNGRYSGNEFKDDCKAKLQSLTFCGFGAHQQNGIEESRIKHLTLAGRTMLLHAQCHLPKYGTVML